MVCGQTVTADPDYLEKVRKGIVEAVVEADAKRGDAKGNAGYGLADPVVFSCRFKMEQGRAMTHSGQGSPDIIKPVGQIDPRVGVLGVWDAGGKFLGCVVNFACHGTTGSGGISADYIGCVVKTIRGLMGGGAGVVFVNGFYGDVIRVDNQSPYQIKRFGEVTARDVGGRDGAEALKAMLAMEQGAAPPGPMVAKSRILKLERRPPSPEHLAEAMEIVKQDPKTADHTTWTFAKKTVVIAARIAKEPVDDAEVQAIQVGPVVFPTSTAEFFCQYGLDLEEGKQVPVRLFGVAGQRRSGLHPSRGRLRPDWRRLRDSPGQLQQHGNHRCAQDHRHFTGALDEPRARRRPHAAAPAPAQEPALDLWQPPAAA